MKEKRTRIRRKNAGYKKILFLLIILLIILLIVTKVLFPATVSMSKYVYSIVKGAYLSSKEFYFTSDMLDRTGKSSYKVSNWNGEDYHNFQISLSSKKNEKKQVADDMNIDYILSIEVEVCDRNGNAKPDGTFKVEYNEEKTLDEIINKIDNSYITFNVDGLSGKIYGTSHSSSNVVSITPKVKFEVGECVKFHIKANSISPYKDEISGTYIVEVSKEEVTYKIDDSKNSTYFNVILTNSTKDPQTAILDNFDPPKVLLDTTSDVYMEAKEAGKLTQNRESYYSKIEIDLEPYESKTVKFYKTDITKDYSYPNPDNNSVVRVK